jgi:hypothetical protein|nr:MAG TPA: hypothetical protein [Caudoviricetes sp.]
MNTISGEYAVAVTKNQPVPKGSDYWKERKELELLYWKFSKEVERLAKDMGAKIQCDDEFINAKVVWRESGKSADELRPFIIGSLSPHAEFHDKFRFCKETMAYMDKDLYYYQREYKLLKKCLIGHKEEPIASIVSLSKDIDKKAEAFYNKYSNHLAVDDIKRRYLSMLRLSDELNWKIESCKSLTVESKGDSTILYASGEKIGTVSRSSLLFRANDLNNKMLFNGPLGGLVKELILKLSLGEHILHILEDKKLLGRKTFGYYSRSRSESVEVHKALEVLKVILDNPIICIKSKEEVAMEPLRKVQEMRENMGLFKRLCRFLF